MFEKLTLDMVSCTFDYQSMSSSIIHYVELSNEETLFPVSDISKAKNLLAKSAHISKQTHLDKCNSIPEPITDSYFHRKC